MQFLKKAIDVAKEEKSLVKLLDTRLSGYRPARGFNKLHASALMSETAFCPREAAIIVHSKKEPKPQYISTPLRVTFDQGDALHTMAREVWLRDLAVGDWKCNHCKSTVYFSKAPKVPCGVCGGNHWNYHEINVVSETTGVSGSLDILLDLGESQLTIVEIKTLSKDEFKTLKAPLAEHRLRTNLYMWLAKDSNFVHKNLINTTQARVLYISKAYGAKNEEGMITPFKEFYVDLMESTLQSNIEKAKKFKLFKDDGVIPDRICPTSFVPRVKSCSCPKECFGSQYPVGEKLA